MRFSSFLLTYRRFLIIITHILLFALAYFASFLLRFEFFVPSEYSRLIAISLPGMILIKVVTFYYFGIFHGLWRYVTISDFWQILKATSLSSAVFIPSVVFLFSKSGFPRSVFILDFILTSAFVCGIRLLTRVLREKFDIPEKPFERKKVLIVGAGRAGILMAKEIRDNHHLNMKVAGFIDDDPAKKHQLIDNIKVLGNSRNIHDIALKHGIQEIILAIPSAKGEAIRNILSYCQIPDVAIKTIPRLDMLLNGDLELRPRDVKPEDLLGREVVNIDEKEIRMYLKNKRVLVTGAGGSIGSELSRQISIFNPSQLILLDHNENDLYFLCVELLNKYPSLKMVPIIGDIKDFSLLKHLFTQYRPQVVFHAAAHKHVSLMEENPAAAVKNNILGTRNLIYASHHYSVERFVLISSDKAVNPINVMGMSKRIGEMILQAKAKYSKTKFMAVRFGNVIGSAGSVVPLFKRQIDEGGPITITHPDVKRYFMCVNEAVSLVLQAGALGKGGEIFILDMGEQLKITDIAKNLVALSGLRINKDIIVKFIGLRRGEKLSEELLLDTEKDRVTRHNKIFVSHTDDFDPVLLRANVKDLEKLCLQMESDKIALRMKEIIIQHEAACVYANGK